MEAVLIDFMGDDVRVANAARVSFKKESDWVILPEDPTANTIEERVLSESDEKLINYLAKHNHWTPFSHVQITLREKVPIFVARQRFKHMVGFTYNEVSRRYVDDAPEFYSPNTWRGRPVNAKQGSSEEIIEGPKEEFRNPQTFKDETAYQWYDKYMHYAKCCYQQLLAAGVAPEQARMVLPQSMYTEYYVTGSLAAWARAYRLRIDPHAQQEIQDLAKIWGEVIGNIKELEHSWKALVQ